jgi:alkanesulfonate monooxygenase SsuD/methylene tetrahydromethanopterin reductase-like flavin-dependent oxidoreductase (luciferase family)
MARDYDGAMAAVPYEFIDRTSLIGPPDRVRDRLAAFAEAGVTTLTVATYAGDLDERIATLRTMVDVLEQSGLAT